jgi:hypothetical protein
MIANILIVALILFIASIMLAIHLARREHGRDADTHPGWDDASMAVLRGNVAGTVTLPAYAQTVPRTEAAGLPPWPVPPTRTEGDPSWPDHPMTASAKDSPRISTARGTDPTSTSSPMTRATAPTPEPWTSGRIQPCGQCGRQSHDTAGHARWLGMVGVLTLVSRPEPAPEPEREWQPVVHPLHPEIRKHLRDAGFPDHATLEEHHDSITMRAVKS